MSRTLYKPEYATTLPIWGDTLRGVGLVRQRKDTQLETAPNELSIALVSWINAELRKELEGRQPEAPSQSSWRRGVTAVTTAVTTAAFLIVSLLD